MEVSVKVTWYAPSRTTDTQWRHKSKISEKLGRCGRQNMLRPYLNIWDWDWIFGRSVKAISSLGVRSPCYKRSHSSWPLSNLKGQSHLLFNLVFFFHFWRFPTHFFTKLGFPMDSIKILAEFLKASCIISIMFPCKITIESELIILAELQIPSNFITQNLASCLMSTCLSAMFCICQQNS